jgi:putative FmdB family regulatory protein
MPTYDYVCDACKHEFEHFQSITSEVLKKCPQCKKSKLRRLIGAGAAIVFKGSGFYQTDYRSSSYKKRAEADKPSESKPADTKSGEESKSSDAASKPAAATEKGKKKSKH